MSIIAAEVPDQQRGVNRQQPKQPDVPAAQAGVVVMTGVRPVLALAADDDAGTARFIRESSLL